MSVRADWREKPISDLTGEELMEMGKLLCEEIVKQRAVTGRYKLPEVCDCGQALGDGCICAWPEEE